MFLQYELWKDCNNGCKYCFNQFVPKVRDKKATLKYAIKNLENRELEEGSTIGFMGGEFFGGQLEPLDVKYYFYELVDLTIQKLGPTGRFCIMSALMADDKSDWFEFCDYIHDRNYDKNVLVCTSWDAENRFTERTLKNWEETMRETQKRYPDMRIHVEMILTEYLIQNVMTNPNYLKEFEEKWNCRVDFNIPYLPIYSELMNCTKESFEQTCPGFFPKRKSFLNMLKHNSKAFDLDGISNHSYHSSELHYALNDKDWIVLPERDKMETTCINQKPCNNCCGYADSTIKIQDDIKMFIKSFM